MKTLYIGGQKFKKNTGTKWKIYFYLFLFLMIVGLTLKVSGSLIVEKWINKKGTDGSTYAFSVREVGISLGKGELNLKDVKVFNLKTSAELLEAANLSIQINLSDLILSQEKNITVSSDKIDLIISKDFSSELEREKKDLDIDKIEAKFTQLNIIEKKEDSSRTVLELNAVNAKVKALSEFTLTSKVAEGGSLNLTGKANDGWSFTGSFQHVPSGLFNRIAGDKLPFSFNESRLNADILAETENGKLVGEIAPKIRKLNLVEEKPGIPAQTIARILSDELTFTLPFTVRNEVTLEYSDTFRKLKMYRKYPMASEADEPKVTQSSPGPKTKKSFSFWPF